MADIHNFYLNNDLPETEYMQMHRSMIPEEICNEYNIHDFVDDRGATVDS